MVSDDTPTVELEDVPKTWILGRGGPNDTQTYNVLVEFLTNKKPTVVTGRYNGQWLKEYTYSEYDSEDFKIRRVYDPSTDELVFDIAQYNTTDGASKELLGLADALFVKEKGMIDCSQKMARIINEHKDELPSPN